MVPEGWRQVQVGDTCTFQNGHGFTPKVWDTQGLPIIRIQNLNGSQNFNYFSGVPESRWLVEPGDMLFAWAGTKGVSFGPTVWRGDTGVLNQHIFKVFCADGVDRNWLYLCLRHVTDLIEVKAHGFKATLVHVKKSDIERQPVLLPPLAEQQKIAEILGTWDKAIETTEALLANARAQKRALMQSLLTGARRFPGFDGLEWREAKLGDHAVHITSGSRGWSDYYSETGDVFVRITNLTRVSLQPDWSNLKFVSLPASLSEGLRTRLRKDDLLISITADLGVIGFISYEPAKPHFINQHIALVRFDSDAVYPKFVAYYLASDGMQVAISNMNDSGAKAGLNLTAIRGIDLLLPTLAEQKQIAELLTACDGEIDGLATQLEHLRTEKKSLMQQLMTGKLRLVV